MTREKRLFTLFGLTMFVLLNAIMLLSVTLKVLPIEYFLYVDIAVIVAAFAIFFGLRFSSRSVSVLKLSLWGWLIISLVMLVSNYLIETKITWAYYPIAGALFWPIGVYIYNVLDRKIN